MKNTGLNISDNTCKFCDCILIGSNLTSQEDGDVIIGNKYNELRLSKNGDVFINKKLITNNRQLKSKLESFIIKINFKQ